MAEICCQEAKSTPATAAAVATVSASAAAAVASSVMDRRRRRLEMRRFRLATDLEESAAEYARAGKRQRLSRTGSGPPCPRAPGPVPQRPDFGPRYGFSSVCGRRREMEDAVSVRPNFLPGSAESHFFGVFDGHGCSHVATTCQDSMHEAVADEHSKAAGSSSEEVPAWKGVMERSFARLDEKARNWATNRSGEEPKCRCEQQMPSRCDHVGYLSSPSPPILRRRRRPPQGRLSSAIYTKWRTPVFLHSLLMEMVFSMFPDWKTL